jgi:predicted enzyme related to lactoylglutathione lyase
MEEARKLTRRLREIGQELRSAGAQARKDANIREAFAKVRELQEDLREAQDDARVVVDKAILKENPGLAKLVQERKEIEGKLRELRGRPFRIESLRPDRGRPRPTRPPAEAPPTEAQDAGAAPTIVHFDIPADDVERAKKFYGELFGWTFEKSPGPMEYWLISASQKKGGEAVGGMMPRQQPQQPITVYFDVPSVDESTAKIQKLGGKVIIPRMAVPGMGYFAWCLDTESSVFAVWETDQSAK